MRKTLLALMLGAWLAPAGAQVLVEDSRVQLTVADMEQALERVVPERLRASVRGNEVNLRTFLQDYYTYATIASAARELGLDQDPALAAELEYNVRQFLTHRLIDRELAATPRPDYAKLAKEEYKANPERFLTKEQVHARHILLHVTPERDKEATLALANDLLAQLRKNPKRFEELAREYSDDPTAANNGGDLGFFEAERMVPAFSKAAFALTKKAPLSEPLESPFGIHLIQLVDRKPAGRLPFAEVSAALTEEMEKRFLSTKRQELVDNYRFSEDRIDHEEAVDAWVEQVRKAAADNAAKP